MTQDQQSQQQMRRELDEALIAACIRGDERAWSQFVDRYGRLVYAVPARMGLPPDACEDILQNVFAIAFGELSRIRDRASIPKWLITVSHRETCRWLRRAREAARGDRYNLLPEAKDALPEQELARLERRHLVHEALERLGGIDGTGDRCRDLITALFLAPSTPNYKEISRRLKIPVGAIGPTRNRCLRKLLRLLEDRLEE